MSESEPRKGRPGDNWEISISSPTNLEVDPGLERENQKLSPRPQEGGSVENISTDECWLINIKAPATLSINRGDPDTEGNQETVISELEEEKGNFLCGPEWKVRITTKVGQELDIKQIEDGSDFRVLISPLPPKVEEVKKVEKVKEKKADNRYLYSGGKIYFSECRLYYKPPPGVPYMKATA